MRVSLEVSVVVPVKDEAGNAVPLLQEIVAALRGQAAFEAVFVDDGSRDETLNQLLAAKAAYPELRVIRHASNCGQSRGIRTGVMYAKAPVIVTLDGDGQNDPADIPKLLGLWRERSGKADTSSLGLGMVAGQRFKRQDNFMKRFASRVGNGVRQWLLQDNTRDTGCGLKLFLREGFLRLPYFDHMHRFLPALMLREGYEVAHLDVNHRPRGAGRSKYGTLDRLMVSIRDIMGVAWLMARARKLQRADEV